MRRTTIGLFALAAIALAGCGSTKTFANRPRPPTPVDLTVYINDARVSVSPNSIGAGPVNFIVTNQSTKTQTLSIQDSVDPSHLLASTGPINPEGTAQVTVDFTMPNHEYTVATGPTGQTQAALAQPTTIHPAALHIGAERPNADNVLLQP
jgi:hypothetical protein